MCTPVIFQSMEILGKICLLPWFCPFMQLLKFSLSLLPPFHCRRLSDTSTLSAPISYWWQPSAPYFSQLEVHELNPGPFWKSVPGVHPSSEEESIYWLIDNKLPFAVPSGWKDTLFQARIWTAAWRQSNVSRNTFNALFIYFGPCASVITFFDVQIGPCTCGSTYTVDSFIISEPINH